MYQNGASNRTFATGRHQRQHDRERQHRQFRMPHQMCGMRGQSVVPPLLGQIISEAHQTHRRRTLTQLWPDPERLMTFVIS
jgi:hypothetical protein